MTFNIGDRLAIYGWKRETEDFFFVIACLWWREYESKYSTVEQMLFEPTDCINFCNSIRVNSGIDIPNNEILRTLCNLRKGKYLMRVEKYARGIV
jgi:hypothetical protein